jgi:5'-nucleotidase
MKRLLFDMDNVLVDFQSGIDQLSPETLKEYEGRLDEVPGIFGLMKPVNGAIEAYHLLSQKYDCYIVSTAPWENPSAWSDKPNWVKKYLGKVAHKRLTLTHHKNICEGDYIIDDRMKNGVEKFKGEVILFLSEDYPTWDIVLNYLMNIS